MKMRLLVITTILTLFGHSLMAYNYILGSEKDLDKNLRRLSPVKIDADLSPLSKKERQALDKIIEAARMTDGIYLRQVWSGNPALQHALAKDSTPLGQKLFHCFQQNVGPWSRLDDNKPFLNDVPKEKPKLAGFYPDDMTQAEFEKWEASLDEKGKAAAQSFFTVIVRKTDGKLEAIPYSEAYAQFLGPAARLLDEAADLTEDPSLKHFLLTRAAAFRNNDYYESDLAWMDLHSVIEPTIGPYETYEDEQFNYKAAFEAFVTLRNDRETKLLEKFSSQLQDIEDHLPLAAQYRNPKLGALSPIRVVDQVFTAGEARRGVMTAAFNLPNDEKVIKEKGSKRVMLKNVQEAKFEKVLKPISQVALGKGGLKLIAFDPFFTHILMHELMHGLGPHNIKIEGKDTTVRMQLKDLYSAIEEAKADITGLFAMQYLMDKGVIDKKMQDSMYTTFLASCFRSVRFGITEAHGKGIALQFNYLTDKGAFVEQKDGTFTVDSGKIKSAVTALTGELLTLQAEGSYAKTKALLDKYAVVRPAMQRVLNRLKDVPVDIEPYYPVAGETGK